MWSIFQKKNPEVYLVTSGFRGYSGYQLHGVFSDKEQAEKFVSGLHQKLDSKEPIEIKTFQLDQFVGYAFRPSWTTIISLSNGNLIRRSEGKCFASPVAEVDYCTDVTKECPSQGVFTSLISQEHADSLATAAYEKVALHD